MAGYTGLAFVLGLWFAYPALSRKQAFMIPKATLVFAVVLSLTVVASAFFWERGADVKDVVGLYAFYVFIPTLYIATNRTLENLNTYVHRALKILFFATAGAVGIDFIFNGFALYESSILGLNKNAVAFFFEVIYCYMLFESHDMSSRWTATIIGVGLATLFAIFSKTAIGFGVVFTLGYFSSLLFWLSLLSIGVVGASITFLFERASLVVLRTAVDRALLWSDALREVLESWTRFLFGYGPGNYVSDIQAYGLVRKEAIHNYYLQIAHGFGAATLTVILSYFFWVYQRFGVLTSGPVAAFWIFNLHATFDVGWVTGQGFLASLILGVILARNLPGSSFESASSPTEGSLATGTRWA
jgi:hypothetical protein